MGKTDALTSVLILRHQQTPTILTSMIAPSFAFTAQLNHLHPFVHRPAKGYYGGIYPARPPLYGARGSSIISSPAASKYSNLGHCRPPGHKSKLDSESRRVGITPLVSYQPSITHPSSLPRLLNSLSPCISWSFARLTDPLRYSDSGSTTPVQTPVPLTSDEPNSWIQHHLFANCYKQTCHSNRLIGCAQPCGCSVVLFHRSSELLDNLLVDSLLHLWR